MKMAINIIETFKSSIDVAEVLNMIKHVASFGVNLFKIKVPLDETFSLGQKHSSGLEVK
jgi:hypothetical protein